MSTASTPTAAPAPPPPAIDLGTDAWLQVPATWEAYLALCAARGESSHPQYTFLEGRLTIVSPGNPHEWIKTRLGWLIETMLLELDLDFFADGSVTLLKNRDDRTGTEADETYYLDLANIGRVHDKKNLLMGEDPPPDLVVEVVVSHPPEDKIEVYRRFGIREVWMVSEGELEFLVLGEGGYAPSPSSLALPTVRPEDLTPWLYRVDPTGDRLLRKAFRAWVDETLVPRHRQNT